MASLCGVPPTSLPKSRIFGIEIAVRQALDDSGSFGRVVKSFGGLFECKGYALCRVFLHEVLIRFHLIDC